MFTKIIWHPGPCYSHHVAVSPGAKVLCERQSQKVDARFMVTGSGAFSTGMQFLEHEVGWQLIPFPESRGCGACRVDSGGPWPGPRPGACCVPRSALWERAATVLQLPHCQAAEERIPFLNNKQQQHGQRRRRFTVLDPVPILLAAKMHQARRQVLSAFPSFSSVLDNFLWSPNKACFFVCCCYLSTAIFLKKNNSRALWKSGLSAD